jgi:dTDP-4-dehydrorhamnose 3,5-epimerase
MKRLETSVHGAYIFEPTVFGDYRGYFMETYSQKSFSGLVQGGAFVQDNESYTAKAGTLRGIHFQNNPMSQAKLVRVTQGAVKDMVIDLRRGSPTYLVWQLVELSAENKRMLYLPRGCGHGFLTLTDSVQFCYKVDALYSKELDRSIRFDDPDLNVDWGIADPVLSEKDKNAALYKDSDCNFFYHDTTQNGGGEPA